MEVIWKELELFKVFLILERELEKLKNKVESILIFLEFNVVNKAMNFGFFELFGDVDFIN